MHQFATKKLSLTAIFLMGTLLLNAQVKIGGSPAAPHPSAVLHLDDSTKGLLLPVVTASNRNAIASPAPGLLLYNKTNSNLNFYNGSNWQRLSTDTAEWKFDSVTKRINLVRGYDVADTIFYDTATHRFNFTDRFTYTNSLGNNFTVDAFFGKYNFKTTASKSNRDSATTNTSSLISVYEVDNADTAANNVYTSISAITTVNPKANQKINSATGLNSSALHAGNDTAFNLAGIRNGAYPNGLGYTEILYGIYNNTFASSGARNDIGTMYGIYNLSTRSTTATTRIKGNYYGYFGFLTNSMQTRVDGTSYGIFLTGVSGAALGNYAIYTNQGRNRFGDSVVVSNVSALPRAFFDINNTTSMIVPTGLTASRPATGVVGMLRYNTENGGFLETYNGTQWSGTIRNTTNIDIPSISAGTGYTATVTVAGATPGSSVSVSPTSAMANGLIISYARVSAANTVEIRFNLLYGAAIDPAAENYYIRVMQ
jgi:hypothetical protein